VPMGNDRTRRKRLIIIITFGRSGEGRVRGKEGRERRKEMGWLVRVLSTLGDDLSLFTSTRNEKESDGWMADGAK